MTRLFPAIVLILGLQVSVAVAQDAGAPTTGPQKASGQTVDSNGPFIGRWIAKKAQLRDLRMAQAWTQTSFLGLLHDKPNLEFGPGQIRLTGEGRSPTVVQFSIESEVDPRQVVIRHNDEIMKGIYRHPDQSILEDITILLTPDGAHELPISFSLGTEMCLEIQLVRDPDDPDFVAQEIASLRLTAEALLKSDDPARRNRATGLLEEADDYEKLVTVLKSIDQLRADAQRLRSENPKLALAKEIELQQLQEKVRDARNAAVVRARDRLQAQLETEKIAQLNDQAADLRRRGEFDEAAQVENHIKQLLFERDPDLANVNDAREQAAQLRLKGKHDEAQQLDEQANKLLTLVKVRYQKIHGDQPVDQRETTVFLLNHVRSSEVTPLIKILMSGQDLKITPGPHEERLFVRGSAEVVREFSEILRAIDVPATASNRPSARTNPLINRSNPFGAGRWRPSPKAVPGMAPGLPESGVLDVQTPRVVDVRTSPVSSADIEQQLQSLNNEYQQLEQQAAALAASWRDADSSDNSDAKLLAAYSDQLRNTVKKAFETRQKLQELRIKRSRRELDVVEQQLQQRAGIADRIIERRVQELLHNADTLWVPAPARVNQDKVADELIGRIHNAIQEVAADRQAKAADLEKLRARLKSDIAADPVAAEKTTSLRKEAEILATELERIEALEKKLNQELERATNSGSRLNAASGESDGKSNHVAPNTGGQPGR